MADVIKEFVVALGFDVKSGELNKFNGGIKAASVQAAALGAAVLAAAGAVTAFVSQIADQLDQIADVSERTNTAASAIDKMGYIAELTDSSLGAVTGTLEALSKAAGDTAMGIGRAKLVFEKIGVSVKDQNGKLKDTTKLLGEVGNAIKGMEKGEQIAVMERLGIDRTMLKAITGDVAALSAEYDKMMVAAGFSFDEAAAAASDYEDSQIKLGLVFKKLQQSIAVKFMRGIATAFERLTKMLVTNMPAIVKAITPVINAVMILTDAIFYFGDIAMQVIGVALDGWRQLNEATNGFAGYIAGAIVAWQLLNATFLASPIGIVLGLAAAIALLYEDFKVWQEGGKSLIPWEKWIDEINKVKQAFTDFMNWLQPYTDIIFGLFDKLGNLGSFIGGSIPVSIPSVGGAGAGTQQSVNQQTVINVNGGDPNATARAVAGQQDQVNANMTRNMKGSAR
jgi:hypothetical protein